MHEELVWHDGDMPYSPRFGDHYYTREGGRAEVHHVFLGGNGLPHRWRGRSFFRIGELGFGTALNLIETWYAWRSERASGQQLEFVSFEAYPLRAGDIARALAAWPDLNSLVAEFLSHWPVEPAESSAIEVDLDCQTRLRLIVGDVRTTMAQMAGEVDAWYLDGFAPSRNPQMWEAGLLKAVRDRTAPTGTFATYSAAGWVRRNLAAAGFQVEKVPGYGSKREMLRGQASC